MESDVEDQDMFTTTLSNTSVNLVQRLLFSYLSNQSHYDLYNNNYPVMNSSTIESNVSSNIKSLFSYQTVSDTSHNTSIGSISNLTTTINDTSVKSDMEKLNEFMTMLRSQVLIEKIIYSFLFVIGSLGNSFVLYNLFQPKFKSKMNYLIRHLAVADLMVIFLTIGVELIWRITIKWETGELGCKIVQFWRIFPLYLTSLMMICISVDRFYAFVFPLTIFKSKERNYYLIVTSYVISFIASIPQVILFLLHNSISRLLQTYPFILYLFPFVILNQKNCS